MQIISRHGRRLVSSSFVCAGTGIQLQETDESGFGSYIGLYDYLLHDTGRCVCGLDVWMETDGLHLFGRNAGHAPSTTIIYKAFDDLGLRQQRFAGLVLSILILEDILAIVLMVMLSTMAVSKNFEGSEMIYSIGKLVFFPILWFVVGIYLIPLFLKRARKLDE